MEYYRDSQYLIWIENNIIWYKLHQYGEAVGYDIFTYLEVGKKPFKWHEPKSKIFDGQEAEDKYNNKILQITRELKLNKILNDL